MDDEKPSTFPIALCGRLDADAAPTVSARASSSVVYFGSAERISEGFALALRAMGLGQDILPEDIAALDKTAGTNS